MKFLLKSGFVRPAALLAPDLLLRIGPSEVTEELHAAHQAVLLRLIDPAVFQRMAQGGAALGSADKYVGVDLIRDLNGGLFSELQRDRPVVDLYRRDLQRTYVHLLAARARGEALPTPPADDTDSPVALEIERTRAYSLRSTQPGGRAESRPAGRSMQEQAESSVPSEFRAALRQGMAELASKMKAARERVRDEETALHLTDLLFELEHGS